MEKIVKINDKDTTYTINEKGELYNHKTKRKLKGTIHREYIIYSIHFENKKYDKLAHRLVAEAFIPNPHGLPAVNHKDGNKLNNSVNNLEWISIAENNQHAYDIGLKPKTNGVESRLIYTEDLPDEQWKCYKDTNYYISNFGRVRNIKTGNLMKGKINKGQYKEYCLTIDGKKRSLLGHRLVYETFIGALEQGKVINHKDGNKENNCVDNLEQITAKENILHSYYTINSHKEVRQVAQYDLNDNLIAIYASCAEAARNNPGTFPNLIVNVCNGKTLTHKGFKWKYIDKE